MKFTLLDIEQELSGQEQDTILFRKGNQIHTVLLYLSGLYSMVYLITNWLQGFELQALINFLSLILIGVAIYLNIIGYHLASKLLNLILLITVISLMFYYSAGIYSHEGDSILVFFIPVSLGTLIVFQGREQKYGYLMAALIFILMVILMLTDLHHEKTQVSNVAKGVSTELILNLTGATLATFLEVAFILLLSNKIDEKLLKTNKELDSFVYSVSHDLRSPLLSVKGLLQLSKDTTGNDEALQKYLSMAENSIDHLDETIREILAYSRNTRLEVDVETFDVGEMVDQIYQDLRFTDDAKLEFSRSITGLPYLRSDKSRINTVLRNLIGNAVKYRQQRVEGSFVRTVIQSSDQQMVISVEDNGEGISSDNLLKVFDMFFRGTSTGQGTGLGLYICKETLLRLNGKIEASSEPGKGTVMTVTIPNNMT